MKIRKRFSSLKTKQTVKTRPKLSVLFPGVWKLITYTMKNNGIQIYNTLKPLKMSPMLQVYIKKIKKRKEKRKKKNKRPSNRKSHLFHVAASDTEIYNFPKTNAQFIQSAKINSVTYYQNTNDSFLKYL